ncbi:MAG: hypothetical protein U7127_06440 [Phormidium sp.]
MNNQFLSYQKVESALLPLQHTEAHLSSFVQWVLQTTSGENVPTDAALELLDRAWEAQKLLWQLQEG